MTVAPEMTDPGRPRTAIRGVCLAGAIATFGLVGLLGTWSATTPIASAIVAQGRVVVEGNIKVVQHQDGGIVSEIAVSNGDHVSAGQLLARLSDTELSASLKVLQERLAGARALLARLDAERMGQSGIDAIGPDAPGQTHYLSSELAAQTDIFRARAAVAATSRDRMTEALAQMTQEETGLSNQIAALVEEIGYIEDEIETVSALFERQLTNRDRLTNLQRSLAERRGRLAELRSSKDMLDIRRRDTVLQLRQTENEFLEAVVTERQKVSAEIGQIEAEMTALQDKLDRIEIRAPDSGIVHELKISTVGGVLAPGAAVLEIVPQNKSTEIEARITPSRIDDVHPGQAADITVAGATGASRSKIPGSVRTVSAAAVPDPQTGRDFYRAIITVDADAFADLDLVPIPGMPIEVFVKTGEHTVLAYLLDPVATHLNRAFRE